MQVVEGQRILSVGETRQKIRAGRTKLYRLIGDGTLKTVKIGGTRFVLAESVDHLLTPKAA